jgi:hypothetical protein
MAAEYQEPDWRVADYAPFCLDEKIIDPTTKQPLNIRGPKPARLDWGGYFVCLGAAQTFGRFCQRPFPTILAERLAMPCSILQRHPSAQFARLQAAGAGGNLAQDLQTAIL